MSISGISGQAVAFSTFVSTVGPALAGIAPGSSDGSLIANVDAASSDVSTALQDLSGALGSIIDVSA